MKSPTGRFVGYLGPAVLILGTVSTVVGLVTSRHLHPSSQTSKAVAFKIVSNQTFVTKDGKASLQAVITRVQQSDGSWKQFTTRNNEDGSVVATGYLMGITGLGVFSVLDKEKKLVFRSPKRYATREMNEEEVRKDPTYVGENVVLGFKVLVQRFSDPSDNTYDELYFAPALSSAILKLVNTTADGSYTVIEAVKIQLGEPSESDFGGIPNYPIDYSFYERQIVDADSRGEHDLANQMRQLLEQQKTLVGSKVGSTATTTP